MTKQFTCVSSSWRTSPCQVITHPTINVNFTLLIQTFPGLVGRTETWFAFLFLHTSSFTTSSEKEKWKLQFMGHNILLSAYKDTKEKNFILLEKIYRSFLNISISAENTSFDYSVHQTPWDKAGWKLPGEELKLKLRNKGTGHWMNACGRNTFYTKDGRGLEKSEVDHPESTYPVQEQQNTHLFF